MKILMILDREFPPDIRVEKEIKTLKKHNVEIHLACYTRKNKLSYEEKDGLHIHRRSISKFIYKSSVAALKLPFYFNFWRKFVNKICKTHSFDYIHIHDLPLTKVGVQIKRKFGIPLIVDLHENWPASLEIAVHTNSVLGKILSSNKQWRHYEKTILKHADAIITVVQEMRDRIENLGIPNNKLHIVSNTVNIEEFKKGDGVPNPNYITLFYAGGINTHRGLQIAINALPFILNQINNVRLNIVGSGSYQNTLKELVANLKLENHVNFLGWKNLTEISTLLAESDYALIPHLKSVQTDCSSPNKLYQYIYLKKPILSSNCKSLTRIIKETRSGVTYEHDSPEAFAKAFLKLVDNKNSSIDLECGFQKILKKYNWNVDSERLVNLYDNLNS